MQLPKCHFFALLHSSLQNIELNETVTINTCHRLDIILGCFPSFQQWVYHHRNFEG